MFEVEDPRGGNPSYGEGAPAGRGRLWDCIRLLCPQHLSPWIKSTKEHERERAVEVSAALLLFYREKLNVSVSPSWGLRPCAPHGLHHLARPP